MRILVIHNYYQDPGGEDSVFYQETAALKEKHTVDTLTFRNRKGLPGLLQYLFYPYNLWAAFRLRLKIREFAPDLLHVHNIHYASGPILFRTAHRLKIPVVFTLHNYRLLCPSALLFYKGEKYMDSVGKAFPWDAVRKGVLDHSAAKTFLTAFTYRVHAWLGTWRNVDAFLPLTACAKELLLQGRLGITETQVFVKPNFIDPLPEQRAEKTDTFLFIGRLSEEKGVRQLLQAFDLPDAPSLQIIGDGPLRNLPAGPHIRHLGYVSREKIGGHIAGSKAVVIPSVCLEGFPLALLEAFSRGVPVVLSREVAAAEVIQHESNGFLIDPFHFSEDIKRIDRRDDLEKIGAEGFRTYQKSFTREKVMQQLEEIYRKIFH